MSLRVIVGRFRFIAAKIMGAGRDQALKNADLRGLQDLFEVDTLHIAPEKHGQRFITFGELNELRLLSQNWKIHSMIIARCLTIKSLWIGGPTNL